MRSRSRATIVLALALASAAVGACKKRGAESTAEHPSGAAADPLGEHERALADNAKRLRDLGVALDDSRDKESESQAKPDAEAVTDDAAEPQPRPDPALSPDPAPPLDPAPPSNPAPPANAPKLEPLPAQDPAATRCPELCGLASTACDLRTQICELAEDHVGESRYEDACWRATDQCDRASAACDDCRGTTAGGV